MSSKWLVRLAVICGLACGTMVHAQSLDRGHRVLLDRGLQLQALVFVTESGMDFNVSRWAESNFTTPDLGIGPYDPFLMR